MEDNTTQGKSRVARKNLLKDAIYKCAIHTIYERNTFYNLIESIVYDNLYTGFLYKSYNNFSCKNEANSDWSRTNVNSNYVITNSNQSYSNRHHETL